MVPLALAQMNSEIPAPIYGIPAVFDVMCDVAAWFVWFIIAISTIMVIVSAFNFLTSNGSPEKVAKARKTIIYAAIGVAVVLCSVMFPVIVGTAVGYKSASGQGLTPMCAILGGTGGSGTVTTSQGSATPVQGQ